MADDSIIENSYIVKLDESSIVVYIRGWYNFSDVYGLFCNPERTKKITSHQYGDIKQWNGYTGIVSINCTEQYATVNLLKR